MGTNNNHSNWILPPNYKLVPRIDIWSLLSISSCCAVSSIGAIHSSRGNNGSAINMGFSFSSSEQFALSTSALSFIISFVMAIGLRYAPLRSSLTTNIYPLERLSTQGQRILSSFNITYELLILTLLSIFWMVSMAIICNDASYYNVGGGNNIMDAPSVPLAMAGSSISNETIFYSTWISAILCGYLWVEVYTLNDRRGVIQLYNIPTSGNNKVLQVVEGTQQAQCGHSSYKTPNNVLTKRWTFLSFTSLIIMSSSIVTYNSPSCSSSSDLLRSTSYCSRALFGILIGGALQLLVCTLVAILYRLSIGTGICTLSSLLIQAVNTGLVTSPTGGGPGNTTGTLYFACWMGFIISFGLVLLLIEDVTMYEEYKDDDEQDVESYLNKTMARNGGDLVVVSLYSDDNEDESFVFAAGGGANKNTKSPDVAANKHYGGGQDPEEATSAATYIREVIL